MAGQCHRQGQSAARHVWQVTSFFLSPLHRSDPCLYRCKQERESTNSMGGRACMTGQCTNSLHNLRLLQKKESWVQSIWQEYVRWSEQPTSAHPKATITNSPAMSCKAGTSMTQTVAANDWTAVNASTHDKNMENDTTLIANRGDKETCH